MNLLNIIESPLTPPVAKLFGASFLGLFARTFLLDGVIESFGKTKYLTIITKHPEDIGEYILNFKKRNADGG